MRSGPIDPRGQFSTNRRMQCGACCIFARRHFALGFIVMRCTLQLSGTRRVIGGDRVRRTAAKVASAIVLGLGTTAAPVLAQGAPPLPPPPPPTPSATSTNYDQSAGNNALNLGSNFLERLGNQASGGVNRAFRTNPGGGGASAGAEDPRYRPWLEGYGIPVPTEEPGDVGGPKREAFGGVGGLGGRGGPG